MRSATTCSPGPSSSPGIIAHTSTPPAASDARSAPIRPLRHSSRPSRIQFGRSGERRRNSVDRSALLIGHPTRSDPRQKLQRAIRPRHVQANPINAGMARQPVRVDRGPVAIIPARLSPAGIVAVHQPQDRRRGGQRRGSLAAMAVASSQTLAMLRRRKRITRASVRRTRRPVDTIPEPLSRRPSRSLGNEPSVRPQRPGASRATRPSNLSSSSRIFSDA